MNLLDSLFSNKFFLEIFPKWAAKDGLLSAKPSLDEIHKVWQSLPNAKKNELVRNNAHILEMALPELRNFMAHPGSMPLLLSPGNATEAYHQAITIIKHLWPEKESG